MTTEQRLENLERELARTKRRMRWLLVSVFLGAGLVVLATAWMLSPDKALAENAVKAPIIIHANTLILDDENGKARAMLNVTKDGPALFVYDKQSKTSVVLGVLKDGPVLAMLDENGEQRIGLDVKKDGTALNLFDETGKPRVTVGAGATGTLDGKKALYPESTILLSNKEGKVVWQAP